jgi:hypothetical protein
MLEALHDFLSAIADAPGAVMARLRNLNAIVAGASSFEGRVSIDT